MLELGAHGLVLGGPRTLAEAIAQKGCPITIGVDGNELNDAPLIAANIALRPMNFEELPQDLRGFDFLWSIGTANRMGAGDRARFFIENSVRSLRPGGIAVHIADLWAGAGERPFSSADHLPLRRTEITRLAVSLISHNHEIAQLNFGAEAVEDQPLISVIEVDTADGSRTIEIAPFGLIIRA